MDLLHSSKLSMATVIFVDQENGDVTTTLSKDHVKRTNPGKVLGSFRTEKTRKALGNVNRQDVQTTVSYQTGALKEKESTPVTNQISKVCIEPSNQSYLEIEKCLPYKPADFETFHVPEEYKLSHLCLSGVPLNVHKHDAAKFETLLTREPAPMDIPVINWESGELFSNLLFPDGLEFEDVHSLQMPPEYNENEDPAARRRKKKSYYAKLRPQEIERERELAEKSRAKERRDEETELISTTANYRAVGPTAEA